MKKWQILMILLLASYGVFLSLKHHHLHPEYFSVHGITYQVRVVNGFTNNSSLPLVIWCVSKDGDDMGGRALQEGDDFTWDAKISFWTSAPAFSCTMKWDRTRKRFEAFRDGPTRGGGGSRKCWWLVKEDGFYFSNDEFHWVKDSSWT